MATELKHTHYHLTSPPRQVPGTLLECSEAESHKVENSELWADYMYNPAFGPHSATGLPQPVLLALTSAYLEHRSKGTPWQITDVTADEEFTYRVKVTNRTAYNGDGPTWHTEEWGIGRDGKWRSTYNPHPGYEHLPTSCPNCGY